jgi:hypothetical protein
VATDADTAWLAWQFLRMLVYVTAVVGGIVGLFGLAERERPAANPGEASSRNLFGIAAGMVLTVSSAMSLPTAFGSILYVGIVGGFISGILMMLWYGLPGFGTTQRGVERGPIPVLSHGYGLLYSGYIVYAMFLLWRGLR